MREKTRSRNALLSGHSAAPQSGISLLLFRSFVCITRTQFSPLCVSKQQKQFGQEESEPFPKAVPPTLYLGVMIVGYTISRPAFVRTEVLALLDFRGFCRTKEMFAKNHRYSFRAFAPRQTQTNAKNAILGTPGSQLLCLMSHSAGSHTASSKSVTEFISAELFALP